MHVATREELEQFLQQHPQIEILELMMPNINGFLRCKRIHRREFNALFGPGLKAPVSVPLLGTLGDLYDGLDPALVAGDPDRALQPISGTLAPITWLDSPIAQVLTGMAELDDSPLWADPRNVLGSVVETLRNDNYHPVVATELEFYLMPRGDDSKPEPLRGRIHGTDQRQNGIQYCMAEDLWDCDAFLDEVRRGCDAQGVPMTSIHSEFSSGQWEINTHHVDDPQVACDHALLLKRIVKGAALRHGMAATFMAKPFTDLAGSGLHIHASLYDNAGNNHFAGKDVVTDTLRNAVGGLEQSMPAGMAIFAPNANSYRRLQPGAFAPVSPTWGVDHREVALRIPVSSASNRRVEHRVAGADANPYLTMACVLAGMYHGIQAAVEPGPITPPGVELHEQPVTLPNRWDDALAAQREPNALRALLGEPFWDAYTVVRQGECDDFHARVSDQDYAWYLRSH